MVYLQVYYLKNILNIFGSLNYTKEVAAICIVLLYDYSNLVLTSDKYNTYYFGRYYIPAQIFIFELAVHNDPSAFIIFALMLNR